MPNDGAPKMDDVSSDHPLSAAEGKVRLHVIMHGVSYFVRVYGQAIKSEISRDNPPLLHGIPEWRV